MIFDGDEKRLSEAAFLRDFAGDLPEAKAKVLFAVQESFQKALFTGRIKHAASQREGRPLCPRRRGIREHRRKEVGTRILNIIASPRGERSASIAIIDSFLLEYKKKSEGLVVDTLDVWTESLPEFDAEAIGAKYKGVSGETMTQSERATWDKIRDLASRFQKADRIVLGVPMWNFSFPYKLKQLIDLACQRNMLFTFDGNEYGPALNIDKAFVAYVRGQSEEAGFQTVPPPGFEYVNKYIEFWLHFIGVRCITAMTVEHTWDGRALDMIDEGKKQAAELARQF